MAKGFKMPSFSMPKPNINFNNVKMPDVNLGDMAKKAGVTGVDDIQSAMNTAGVKMPTMTDIREQASAKIDQIKNIKPSDVRDYAKGKLDEIKNIKPGDIVDAAKARYEEAKTSIDDLRNMKQTLEESGVSFNFKGGDK